MSNLASALIDMNMGMGNMNIGTISDPNPIPRLLPSKCHTSYAQDKRNSKKIKNRKRSKR